MLIRKLILLIPKKGNNYENIDNQDTPANNQGSANNQGNLSANNNPSTQERLHTMDQCPLPNHQGHTWGGSLLSKKLQ
jgi:hypothetical protein